ncbi:hypothetical protein M9Y10_021931 [Tritrichomonas musculus]|uniref:Uncharacterized protein n=1 Tax=Tritrichomonas musculus TaxID=1915356 RepID=A0ABR2KR14_9EUKA
MSNFFDDIITPNTMNTMKHLGESFDSYNFGIHQLLNFQFMLYDSLNELAAKFTSLKTEVSFLGNQLLNIDDAVSNYMKENPIEVYTRDGVPIDDALSVLQEKISSLNDRITSINDKNEKFDLIINESASKEALLNLSAELERNTETNNETALAVQMIQKEINRQKDGDDNKWEVIRDMFRQQVEQYGASIDQKVDQSDLSEYVKHSELVELNNLFRSVPDDCRTKIPEIIPQVMRLTGLSMDEKLQRAYDLLHVERKRIDNENYQLNEAFQSLKQTAIAHQQYNEQEHQTDFIECEVRDVSIDSGQAEVSDTRYQQIKRYSKRYSVMSNFDGPDNVFCEREGDVSDILEGVIRGITEDSNNNSYIGNGIDNEDGTAVNANVKGITSRVIEHCQGIIERQLGLIMNSFGVKIDKNEIVTLIRQLNIVEDLQKQIESLNVKMTLKIDQSLFYDELKKYMLKEEFFEKCGDLNNSNQAASSLAGNGSSMLPKVTSRSVQKRAKTDQRNRPVPLVPARNPYMIGVNDKFLKGKDNKLYLRETTTIADKNYKEPPITGGMSKSYYERSKMSMEIEGIEAAVDFQPFVPADEVNANKKNVVPVVQVETYQFGSTS